MANVNPTELAGLPDFHPTTKQLRRWDRLDRAQAAFNVTYWQVVEDRRLPNGRRYLGLPLSPMLATKQACRRAYAEIKGKHPRAYRMRGTFFFHWDEPKDLAARQWALREIRRNVH
ncbi:hypothetical protein [Burkholderia anthina]|uniref:hypothetical protein n=1 Tax=Burkholderia anthina TaxID=179879 RepID=UPI00158CDDA6|nr:hypothetical protein [Burkholderia anthina]